MYGLKEDLGSISHENYTWHFYRIKKKKYIVIFAEDLVFFLVTKNYKGHFEAAVISAINKALPDSVMAGCNLNFKQFL